MARLNDLPQPGHESFEAVKKRYIRQNREIARVNSTQSIRIRSLETETTRLLTENIDLREQVIKLQASLDRRERGKAVAENVEATKKQLEGKVVEMQELLTGLGKALSLSPKAKPRQKAYIVSPEQRTWKRGLSFSEVMGTEDTLPAISEDSRRSSLNSDELRRTSLGSESRRSSLNFEEITLLPPRADDVESDEDLKPPASSMFDVRPRRRRDSSRQVDLEISRLAVPPKTQPTADNSEYLEKPKKGRYEDRDQAQDIEPTLDLEFKFTKLSQRTMDMMNQAEIQKPIVSVVTLDEPEYDTEPMNEDEIDEIKRIVGVGMRAEKMDLIEKKDPVPPKETITTNVTSTVGRRALGPKSTNSDPSNSPLKQAAIKTVFQKERDLEKLGAELPPPKMKPYRESHITEIPPPDAELAAGTGRSSRRTKTTNVNYALPNLRDKMRRDDNSNEAVKSEGRSTRRSTGSRLKNRDSSEELVLKKGELGDEGAVLGNQWLEPTLPHATTLAVDAVEEPRKTRETGIGGLLEKQLGREKNGELELPATVMTHRKRRSNNLHQGKLMDLGNDTTERSAPFEPRRKTVSFDPESTQGGEARSRDRTESTSTKRKNLVHSHLPSSHADEVGEASMALNEAVRSARKATLIGAGKVVRGARSTNSLNTGGDGTGVENNHTAIITGMASRRRSMMV